MTIILFFPQSSALGRPLKCSLKIHYHPYKSRPVAILVRVFYGGRHIKLKIIKRQQGWLNPWHSLILFSSSNSFAKCEMMDYPSFNVAAQIFVSCLFRCCVFLKHIFKKCIFQKAFGSLLLWVLMVPRFYHFSIHLWSNAELQRYQVYCHSFAYPRFISEHIWGYYQIIGSTNVW